MNTHVITHGGCVDGFTSAYLLSKAFPDAVFHNGEYGTPPPADLNGRVIIADFSYPLDDLRRIADVADSVTVLDHHVSRFEELQGNDEFDYVFDNSRCGASLVWSWLYEQAPVPLFVEYVEDMDLYTKALPFTEEVSARVHGTSFLFEAWDRLFQEMEADFEAFVATGAAVLRSLEKLTETQADLAVPVCIDGLWTMAAPAPYMIGHQVAHVLTGRNPELPFAAYFIDGPTGRKYGITTRDPDFDVSEVATRFGGGGHRSAAGFLIPAENLGTVYSEFAGAQVVELWSNP